MPLIVKDLHDSKVFLRWKEALEIGVNRGLGIPYPHPSGQMWVMTFLSARDTPIARRFEIWVPTQEQDFLILHANDRDQDVEFATKHDVVKIDQGDGAIGQAWATKIPTVVATVDDQSIMGGMELNAVVAVPFMNNQELKAVMAWHF